jgi:integrase
MLASFAAHLEAFDLWCRRTSRIALPATPEIVSAILTTGQEGRQAGLSRPLQGVDRQDLSVARPQGSHAGRAGKAAGAGDPPREGHRPDACAAASVQRTSQGRGARQAPRPQHLPLLEACGDDLTGLRDRALLSTAYGTGLRASELRATAFLSPRSVRAIAAWTEAAEIPSGPLFRRVQVRRYKARATIKGRRIDSISGRETWDLRKTMPQAAIPARVEYDIGSCTASWVDRTDLADNHPAGV